VGLNAAQLPFVQHVDCRRTIRKIAERLAQLGRKLFRSRWRLDFLAMGLDGKAYR
jgi:hypothetical protein